MIPRPIYEALPSLCISLGFVALLGVDPLFGKLAAGLLIFVGFVIFRLRHRYRCECFVQAFREARVTRLADSE